MTFFISFTIWIPFISFSSLIAMTRIFKVMLSYSGQSGHPWLVPDFRENAFSFTPLKIRFTLGFSYMIFILLRWFPSMPTFWRVYFYYYYYLFIYLFLLYNIVLVLPHINMHPPWVYMCSPSWRVYIFQYVYMVYQIDWFAYIEESLDPWDKAYLVYEPFHALLNSVC